MSQDRCSFGNLPATRRVHHQNHTLIDGNKRLAWAAAVTFLALNGHPVPDIDVDTDEAFMLSTAQGKLTHVAPIEEGLRARYLP